MNYHDDIITIKLCRGELAVTLGEQGLMVENWNRLTKALERELSQETPCREDGHTGSSAIGDLLIGRLLDRGHGKDVGIVVKPTTTGHKHECWPFEEKWFDGGDT